MNDELDKKLHSCMSEIWKAYRAKDGYEDAVIRIKDDLSQDPDYKYLFPFIEFMACGLVPAINHHRGLI